MRYIADKPISVLLLMIVAAVIMSPALFCGFEWCDTGFYMTFYDNMFSHPESVSFNFMYYLSGLIGATALKIWNSILCIRVVGLLFYLGCLWLMWRITRRDGIFLPQLLAVILISVGVLSTPLAFYNDILSVFLALCSLTLLSESAYSERVASAQRRKLMLLLLSGLIAGLNTYSRIPNILEIFFVFLVPCLFKKERRLYMSVWGGGWLTGVGLGLLIVITFGHLCAFGDMLRDLYELGTSRGRESTHAFTYLVMKQLVSWRSIGLIVLELLLIYAAARLVFYKIRICKQVTRLLWSFIFFAISLAAFLNMEFLPAMIGVSMTGLLVVIFDPFKDGYPQELKRHALMAVFMVFILPLGSDNAVFCCGTILLFLALPIALVPLCRSGKVLTSVACGLIAVRTLLAFYDGDAYFDGTPVAKMRPVCSGSGDLNGRLYGVMTSADRCRRMMDIYEDVSSVVLPGDTLMVYGSAPMLNYMTLTIPAYGCSWPELLTAAQIGERLESGRDPRYIIVFKFRTMGTEWSDPSAEFMRAGEGTCDRFHTGAKSRIILQFLENNNYCLIKDKPDFSLYRRSAAD